MFQSYAFYFKVNDALAEHCITCNKVEDNGIGTLICIHGSGDVSDHSTWRGVLGYRQLLIRQATTLKCSKEGNMHFFKLNIHN